MSPLARYVVETVVTLLAVAALAVLVLYLARRAGVGSPSGPLQLVGRLPLDPRKAVYLVRVVDQVYVIGSSEAGLSKLGELGETQVEGLRTSQVHQPLGSAFARLLRKEGKRPTAE